MRRLLILSLMLVLPALIWAGSVEQILGALSSVPVEPVDSHIGILSVDGPHAELAGKLLSEPYSLEWVEQYVEPAMRYQFTNTYTTLLSSLLPQTSVVFGQEHEEGGLCEVPVRLSDGRYLTLDFRSSRLVAVSVTDAYRK